MNKAFEGVRVSLQISAIFIGGAQISSMQLVTVLPGRRYAVDRSLSADTCELQGCMVPSGAYREGWVRSW